MPKAIKFVTHKLTLSEVLGMKSVTMERYTAKDSSTVMETPFFSPASAGSRNTKEAIPDRRITLWRDDETRFYRHFLPIIAIYIRYSKGCFYTSSTLFTVNLTIGTCRPLLLYFMIIVDTSRMNTLYIYMH